MKKTFTILAFILLVFNLCAAKSITESEIPVEVKKTQVVIIGTIHSAHHKNPNYSADILKEIILSLKPAAILNELPLSQVEPYGRPLERIRRKDNPSGPESWAADTVAQQLGIKQVPFDRPDRQENFRKTKYFERQTKANELRKKCGEYILQNEPNSLNIRMGQLQRYAGQSEASLFLNAKPEVINSEAHDSIIRIKASLWYEIVPEILEKYPECKDLIKSDLFFRDQWNIRNKIMANNIIKAVKQYPKKRLVALSGATHRYILRDLLKDNPYVELKEYWEIVGVEGKNQEPNLLSEKVLVEEQFNPAECFDKIWQTINDKFWDPNFNGVNWEDAGKRYRPKALAAKDHESFAVIINQMLAELKTSHNHYYTKWEPKYYTLQAALISDIMAVVKTTDTSVVEKITPGKYSSRSNPHRTGIGIVTKKIDDHYYVSAVLATSPAEKAGIVIGDRLVKVNGQPFHPIRSFQNKAGQEVELTIQRGPSESTRRLVTVIPLDKKERELFEVDTQARMKTIGHKGHRFSYIRLWWLGGRVMRKALDWAVNDADKVEGIIIDIRDGFGAGPADEYMEPFLKNSSETVAHKEIGRTRTFRSTVKFEKTGKFEKPVIIIINGGTRSAKEVLAYYFRKTKRGVLIGECTAGFVSGGGLERISGDSLLLYCKYMKVVDGKLLEGIGVEPDIDVPFDIRFAGGRDVQLEQAKDEMVKLIEAS